jgi:hypothetical protein
MSNIGHLDAQSLSRAAKAGRRPHSTHERIVCSSRSLSGVSGELLGGSQSRDRVGSVR